MKKILFFLMIYLGYSALICAQEISVDKFLENYFSLQSYNQKKYIIEGRETIFAYHEKRNGIFDRAIMLTIESGKSVRPLFYIQDNSLFNSSELLFTGNIQTQVFYGWEIHIVEKNSSFSLSFYTDNGLHVTDGPIFIWDRSKMKFLEYVIDKTMM